MLYFAYGSNIDVDSMTLRCPTAKRIGRARLDGYELFVARSGYLSIRGCESSVVLGVVWEIDEDAERALDDYEGVDEGLYIRRIMRLSEQDADALVYVEASGVNGTSSPPGYLESVAAAMKSESFPDDYVASLFGSGRTETTSSRESSTSKISSNPSS